MANVKVEMTAEKLQEFICKTLCSKKATNVQSVFVKDKTVVADYYVIASGRATVHVKSLIDYVDEELSKIGIEPVRREGVREGRWAVLDYGDVVVHVFNDEARDFYQLERLWADDKNVIRYED